MLCIEGILRDKSQVESQEGIIEGCQLFGQLGELGKLVGIGLEKLDNKQLGTACEVISLAYEILLSDLSSPCQNVLIYTQNVSNRAVNNVDDTEKEGELDKSRGAGGHRINIFLRI